METDEILAAINWSLALKSAGSIVHPLPIRGSGLSSKTGPSFCNNKRVLQQNRMKPDVGLIIGHF